MTRKQRGLSHRWFPTLGPQTQWIIILGVSVLTENSVGRSTTQALEGPKGLLELVMLVEEHSPSMHLLEMQLVPCPSSIGDILAKGNAYPDGIRIGGPIPSSSILFFFFFPNLRRFIGRIRQKKERSHIPCCSQRDVGRGHRVPSCFTVTDRQKTAGICRELDSFLSFFFFFQWCNFT